jgi:hypothetical protein
MGEDDLGEDDLGDDLEDEVEIDDIPMSQESVEAEIEGHALVNKERLEKGLTSKPKQKVKNAVPVTKKKAQVSKGSNFDGKPQPFKSNPHELTKPAKHNVGGVKVGKGLFDQ